MPQQWMHTGAFGPTPMGFTTMEKNKLSYGVWKLYERMYTFRLRRQVHALKKQGPLIDWQAKHNPPAVNTLHWFCPSHSNIWIKAKL